MTRNELALSEYVLRNVVKSGAAVVGAACILFPLIKTLVHAFPWLAGALAIVFVSCVGHCFAWLSALSDAHKLTKGKP